MEDLFYYLLLGAFIISMLIPKKKKEKKKTAYSEINENDSFSELDEMMKKEEVEDPYLARSEYVSAKPKKYKSSGDNTETAIKEENYFEKHRKMVKKKKKKIDIKQAITHSVIINRKY